MDSEALYQWSLLALLILVSLQLLAGGVFVFLATLQIRRLNASSSRLLKQLSTVLERTDATLVRAVEASGNLSDWCQRVSSAAGTASSTVVDVDAKVERSLTFLQEATTRWAQQSETLLDRFSGASNQVHQAVLNPTSRLSVLLKAVQTGLGHLKPKEEQEQDPSRYHTDQEIFI